MTETGQKQEKHIAVIDFRGVQPLTPERSRFTIAGPVGVELVAQVDGPVPAASADPLSPDGTCVCREPLLVRPAGAGAIAALTLAALGAQVRLLAALADDAFRAIVTDWLQARGIELIPFGEIAGTPALLTVRGSEGERLSIACAGRLQCVTAATLQDALPPAEGTLLLAGFALLRALGPDEAAKVLRHARDARVRTALLLTALPGERLTMEDVVPLLPHAQVVVCTPDALRRVTKRPEADTGARALLDAGAPAVALLRDRHGSSVYRPSPLGMQRTEAPFHLEVEPDPSAPGLVAAGPAYAAAFLWALAHNDNDYRAAAFANDIAARAGASRQGVLALWSSMEEAPLAHVYAS